MDTVLTEEPAVIDKFKEDLEHKGKTEGSLIPLLQSAQESYGYIPEHAIYAISDVSGIPVADIYGVITFYAQFRLLPIGKNVIRVCEGTACHVNGAKSVLSVLQEELEISVGETTPDTLFTLQSVACLGCCSLAPVIMVNNDTHGNLISVDKVKKVLKEYRVKEMAEAHV